MTFVCLDLSGALEAYFGTTLPDDLFFQEITRCAHNAFPLSPHPHPSHKRTQMIH